MSIFLRATYIASLISLYLLFVNDAFAQYSLDQYQQSTIEFQKFQQSIYSVLNVVRNCEGDSSCILSYSEEVPQDVLPILTTFSESSTPERALKLAKVLGNCEADLPCVAQTAGFLPRDAATVIKIYYNCGGDAMCVAESSGMIPQEAIVAVNIVSNCGSNLNCVALSTGIVPKNAAPVVNALFSCGADPACMASSLGFVPKQGVIIENIIQRCGGAPLCIAASSGLVPQDGALVAQIVANCGGEPICVASQWGSVELQRCSRGVGVSGGCFGPNGEIMRAIDGVLPQHLHPDVIARNVEHDLKHGFGKNNEIRKVARRLFGRR